jgi:hypothetical protein
MGIIAGPAVASPERSIDQSSYENIGAVCWAVV